MKITKFPQSCILIESDGTKILIDAGKVKYEDKFLNYWRKADAVLITHKHDDHLFPEIIKQLSCPIYSTKEVKQFAPNLDINIIKENDTFFINKIKIEVVKAIHGYVLPAGEINENVGYIIDDGKTRLYITSDTIRFKNNYKADVMFADITAFDASMNLWGATATFNEIGAKLLIVAHQDAGRMMYDKKTIEDYLSSQNVNYIIPDILQTFEI